MNTEHVQHYQMCMSVYKCVCVCSESLAVIEHFIFNEHLIKTQMLTKKQLTVSFCYLELKLFSQQ